jgi:hypothetical protein
VFENNIILYYNMIKGLFILFCAFAISYIIEKTVKVKPTINYTNKFEYVPILTANIYADILIIFITLGGFIYKSKTLEGWYKKYRLSASIADILIGVLYILLGRYIVFALKLKPSLTSFALLCVIIQLVFDFLFYLFFKTIPSGSNHMLDFFKGYAKDVKGGALIGDSVLVIFAVVLSAFLNLQSFDVNIVLLIISIYLIPYFIYMKD